MNYTPTAQDISRKLVIARAHYISSCHTDEYELERWEDASVEYFNLTGREHPMSRIPLSANGE